MRIVESLNGDDLLILADLSSLRQARILRSEHPGTGDAVTVADNDVIRSTPELEMSVDKELTPVDMDDESEVN